MLLTSVEVQNFRSLEHVKIDDLGQFNVFIGKNNTGKSSILASLQYLASTIFREPFSTDPQTENSLITAHDPLRSLRYILEFQVSNDERERYCKLLVSAGYQSEWEEELLESQFLRLIRYEFESGPGFRNPLIFTKASVLAMDGDWASTINVNPENPGRYLSSNLFASTHIQRTKQLDAGTLAADTWGRTSFSMEIANLHQQSKDLDTLPELRMWLMPQVATYFASAYFFSPHRHGFERRPMMSRKTLAADGSDLPQVLNDLSGNARSRLAKIEAFLRDAVPELPPLHPGVVTGGTSSNPEVEVAFGSPDDYRIRLGEMGGGVEQLLLVATVLSTTPDTASLFLEEPELFLHPGAQKYLIHKLRDGTRQVFVATHSSVFVNLPPPISLYLVDKIDGHTTVENVREPAGFGNVLESIGVRNSDLLFSDAIVFVEGNSDRDTLIALADALGISFENRNITILTMGGGSNAQHQLPARSEVLEGISDGASVPHLFVIDRDERGQLELTNLPKRLPGRIHVLKRREIENYLLCPRSIREAMIQKYQHHAVVLEKVLDSTNDDIAIAIEQQLQNLKRTVLIKRIRSEIGGMPGGLLSRDTVQLLIGELDDENLPQMIDNAIHEQVEQTLKKHDLPRIVEKQRTALDKEWSKPERRLELAPGEEILSHVYVRFGGKFSKSDSVTIASKMLPVEVDPELQDLVARIAALPESGSTKR